MGEGNNRKLVAAGVVVVVVIVGYLVYDAFFDTEDRPPIVVSEGSIYFEHLHPWSEQPSSAKKNWRPDHPNGKDVKKYEVVVTTGTTAACAQELKNPGKVIKIVFGSKTFTFDLKRNAKGDKDEPDLLSTEALSRIGSGRVLRYSGGTDDRITRVMVDSQECSTSSMSAVQVELKAKP